MLSLALPAALLATVVLGLLLLLRSAQGQRAKQIPTDPWPIDSAARAELEYEIRRAESALSRGPP